MTIGRPHSRTVSPGHLLVASKPILPPSPETGEAKLIQKKPFTVAGLAAYLNTSRRVLIDYQEKPKFGEIIDRAKAKIQAYTEERLFDRDGCNGAKFSLINNFKQDDYKDERSIDHKSNGNELESLTSTERYKKIAQLTQALNES